MYNRGIALGTGFIGCSLMADVVQGTDKASASGKADPEGEEAHTAPKPADAPKSEAKADIGLVGDNDDAVVDFGNSHVYVGNLPGLAALNALGDDSPPAAVLGMDLLRLRPKMLLKAKDGAAYFRMWLGK